MSQIALFCEEGLVALLAVSNGPGMLLAMRLGQTSGDFFLKLDLECKNGVL